MTSPVRITLDIATDNVAFDDAPASEVARIISDIASRINDGRLLVVSGERARLSDRNGSTCGHLSVTRY